MFEKQVKAGVELLDGRIPYWRDCVNADELDMHHSHKCIIGQLCSNQNALFNAAMFDRVCALAGIRKYDYGFDSNRGHYEELTKEWLKHI